MRSNDKQNFMCGSRNERKRHIWKIGEIKEIRYEHGGILVLGSKHGELYL